MNVQQTKAAAKATSPLFVGGTLKRKCACGTHVPGGGQCTACRQRSATGGNSAMNRLIGPTMQRAVSGLELTRVPVFAAAQRSAFGGGSADAGVPVGHADSADAGRPAGTRAAGRQADDTGVSAAAKEAGNASADVGASAGTTRPVLSWTQHLRHTHDALWYFGGEHPRWFSTDTHLRASGFTDATQLRWRILHGADKVAFHGPATGAEVVLDSLEGSARANDVAVELKEGGGASAPAHVGHLTVRKPHHLVREGRTNHAACPTWGHCAAACPAWWDEFKYRIKDNVGGTIVGATVNENFPGAKTNDQPNNWPNPAAFATVPFWPDTNGTFVDNWFIACGNPPPLAMGVPNAGQSVDRLPHEFWVGSRTPAHGVRVQRHVAHRYRAFADHENVVSPAP